MKRRCGFAETYPAKRQCPKPAKAERTVKTGEARPACHTHLRARIAEEAQPAQEWMS